MKKRGSNRGALTSRANPGEANVPGIGSTFKNGHIEVSMFPEFGSNRKNGHIEVSMFPEFGSNRKNGHMEVLNIGHIADSKVSEFRVNPQTWSLKSFQ